MKNLIFFLFILPSFSAFCQNEQELLPMDFAQIYQTLPLINPAATYDKYKYTLLAGRQGNTGLFKNTFTNYFYASGNFGGVSRKQTLGIFFWQDEASEIFKSSRAFINYSIHFQLSKKVLAGAGFTGGLFSYRVDAPSRNINASRNVFDGNIGIHIRSDKTYGGISMIQFQQSRFIPLKRAIKMQTLYQILFGHIFSISPQIDVNSLLLAKVTKQEIDGNIYVNALFSGLLVAGINLDVRNSLSVMAGLEGAKISGAWFSPVFSYKILYGSFKSVASPYEITLRMQFRKAEEKGLLFSSIAEY